MKGYHQIRMHPESKDKTAFTCHMGDFQYRRMPIHLTNAPATFQRLMSQLFRESLGFHICSLRWLVNCLKINLEHLKKVLDHLMEVGLKLKPRKCVFAWEQVDYLGHTLSAEGVWPNSAKVEAVKNCLRPPSQVKRSRVSLAWSIFTEDTCLTLLSLHAH